MQFRGMRGDKYATNMYFLLIGTEETASGFKYILLLQKMWKDHFSKGEDHFPDP
jgi:hypothetical protein